MARVRDVQRGLWALHGVMDKKFLVCPIKSLLERFNQLDILPTHYDYPELYRIQN